MIQVSGQMLVAYLKPPAWDLEHLLDHSLSLPRQLPRRIARFAKLANISVLLWPEKLIQVSGQHLVDNLKPPAWDFGHLLAKASRPL